MARTTVPEMSISSRRGLPTVILILLEKRKSRRSHVEMMAHGIMMGGWNQRKRIIGTI